MTTGRSLPDEEVIRRLQRNAYDPQRRTVVPARIVRKGFPVGWPEGVADEDHRCIVMGAHQDATGNGLVCMYVGGHEAEQPEHFDAFDEVAWVPLFIMYATTASE